MPVITSERLLALVSAQVSAENGQVTNVGTQAAVSAFLGTIAEAMLKMTNRITSPSAGLVSGASAAGVAIAFGAAGSPTGSGLQGVYQGVPFNISAAGTISGQLGSNASTTSLTIRKVLVCLSLGDISAVTSSIASNVGTLTFIVGSVYNVSVANAASTGAVSAWFNQVPVPKHSAGLIAVGILNIHNSNVCSVSNQMMTFPLREIYGFDMSAVIGQPVQP